MEALETEFDQVFKGRGGRYVGHFSNSDLFTHALKLSRSMIAKIRFSQPMFPEVYIDIIDSSILNASATKKNNTYYIGINGGTIFLIYDIFHRMLSSKNIFTDLGDITKERETQKIYNAQITDLGLLVREPDEDITPVNFIRKALAQTFMDIILNYLVCHEYAHIMFGHVDYNHSISGFFEINEIANRLDPEQLRDPLIFQTLEMDADSFATNRGIEILSIFHERPDLVVPEVRQFYSNWELMIRTWTFAIYSFFRIFGYSNSLESIKNAHHPPPSVRAKLVMANIYSIFQNKYDNSILDKISKICMNSVMDVEKAFQEISEQGLDLSAWNFSQTNEAYEHGRFLMRNWNNVRPLLEPYTYSQLAPLHIVEQ